MWIKPGSSSFLPPPPSKITTSNFTKRKQLNEENLEEIFNNEDSEFNDSNQRYDTNKSTENIIGIILPKVKKLTSLTESDIQHRTSKKAETEWPHFPFILINFV